MIKEFENSTVGVASITTSRPFRTSSAIGTVPLSYFNRTFKRLYDATPSDIRSAAERREI